MATWGCSAQVHNFQRWGEVLDFEEATRKMLEQQQVDELLTPAEVAALFRVNPKTVTRWARAGKITAIRTLGGHRRFRASEIQRCIEQMELVEQ
jgi:excisionase family DNA binding protein